MTAPTPSEYTGELFGIEYLFKQDGLQFTTDDSVDEDIDEGFDEEVSLSKLDVAPVVEQEALPTVSLSDDDSNAEQEV